jgi:paraquat-inducible protein A
MSSAVKQGFAVCHTCMALNKVHLPRCDRCSSRLHARVPNSVQKTVAFLLAACALYIPANTLHIMTTDQFGRAVDSTILGGVVILWSHGSYPVALIILVASVLVPIGKILSVGALCWSVTRGHQASERQRAVLYRTTELIGKWSMVDVFVVAILVALIQITGIIVITPGPAALAFAGVVILTMIAAEQFDPRLIWDRSAQGVDAVLQEKDAHE